MFKDVIWRIESHFLNIFPLLLRCAKFNKYGFQNSTTKKHQKENVATVRGDFAFLLQEKIITNPFRIS